MSPAKKHDHRLVWSSDGGRTPSGEKTPAPAAATDGIVRVMRETKGRKGKGVTLITGVPLAEDDLKDLARQLKRRCASGGTINNGVIVIQGDHRDTVVDLLTAKGWTVKTAGG